MTKLAVSLRRNEAGPLEIRRDTLSKKRRLPVEIADSYASSRNATISPRRGSNTNSETGRLFNRQTTPEKSWRVPVLSPSCLVNTPPLANTPKRRRYKYEDLRTNCKQEERVWLVVHVTEES